MHGNRQRQVQTLYRSLLRAGRAYPDYNIRDYVVRHVRQDFRKNAGLSGPALAEALEMGASQLALVSRQAAIAAAYPHEQSVMEGLPGGGGGSSSSSASGAAGGLGSSVGSAAAAAGGAPVAQEAAGEDDDESMIAPPREKA